MKRVFILNPQAGFKKTEQLTQWIRQAFGDEAAIRLTEYPGHGTEIAREYENAVIYAVGGDGTANEVMCGTVGTDNPLCVVPAGSGNDFVRTVYAALPGKKRTPEYIIPASKEMEERRIDGAKVNDTYFMNIASVGFDAEVVRNAARYENKPGLRKISYILSMFYTIFHFHGVDLEVEADGEKYRQKALLCCVANCRYYGGGICIAPEADPADGLLETYLIESVSPLRFLSMMPKLARGKHTKVKFVKRISARHIIIRGEGLTLNVDGELSPVEQAEIRVLPGRLKILAPKSAEERK